MCVRVIFTAPPRPVFPPFAPASSPRCTPLLSSPLVPFNRRLSSRLIVRTGITPRLSRASLHLGHGYALGSYTVIVIKHRVTSRAETRGLTGNGGGIIIAISLSLLSLSFSLLLSISLPLARVSRRFSDRRTLLTKRRVVINRTHVTIRRANFPRVITASRGANHP